MWTRSSSPATTRSTQQPGERLLGRELSTLPTRCWIPAEAATEVAPEEGTREQTQGSSSGTTIQLATASLGSSVASERLRSPIPFLATPVVEYNHSVWSISFLGPRGPLIEPLSVHPSRPVHPSRNNFSWVHRWAVTLPSDLRDPSNHTFSESPWCQLSNFGRNFKYRDKYKDKYRDKYKDRDK